MMSWLPIPFRMTGFSAGEEKFLGEQSKGGRIVFAWEANWRWRGGASADLLMRILNSVLGVRSFGCRG